MTLPTNITLDLVLIVVLAVFVLWGLRLGFIRVVGGVVSLVVAVLVAEQFGDTLTAYIEPWFGSFAWLASGVSFFVIFVFVSRAFTYIVELADKTFNMVAIIPFLSTINRLLGAVISFVFGVVVISLLIFVVVHYTPWEDAQRQIKDSLLAQQIVQAASMATAYLPANFTLSNVPDELSFPSLAPAAGR